MHRMFRVGGLAAAFCALVATGTAAAFQNGGFEFNNVPAGDYKYAPGTSVPGHDNVAAAGWTFVGGTGVSHNSTAWTSFVAPEGESYAFIQGGSASVLTQTFDVVNGQTYRVAFKSLTRVYQNSSGTYTYGIGATVYGNSPVDTSGWRDNAFEFTATGASATLTFTGDSTGDNSAFLDQITVTPVPEPVTLGLGAAAIAVALRRRRR